MGKKSKEQMIFRGLLIAASVVIVTYIALYSDRTSLHNILIPFIFMPAIIIMGTMVINISNNINIDLTDAVYAFIFMQYGLKGGMIFISISAVVIHFIREKFITKRNNVSLIIFNICMFIVAAFITNEIVFWLPDIYNHVDIIKYILSSLGFVGTFLLVNISIIKLDMLAETRKYYKFDRDSIFMLMVNFLMSSLVAVTLLEIHKTSGIIGSILIIGILLILHYCFHIYRKLKFRNDAIKSLLKITEDIVKYGEFREKCKHLITNLKELIPYNICAIYTFDIESEEMNYPIAYNAPEGIDIGEFGFDLSSTGITVRTIKEGSIYISKDTRKDKKVKYAGKMAELIKVAVLIPFKIDTKVVGCIMIGGEDELTNFTTNGIDDILHILSNQMALAIENDGIYREMKNKADIDPLTRLYNRRVLDREIHSLIETNTQFSMVIYDIDDFKKVNDKYGHLAGDEVLKMVSEVIKKSIRKTDVAIRYGGEEIVIIFKDLLKEDAYIISERIRNNIELASTFWSGGEIFVTVSGGVSSYPADGKSRDEIIKSADDILYSECKQKGKNRVGCRHIRNDKVIYLDHA